VPEAIIVATGRTPIGRAFKGSLKDLRPDDLAAFIIKTALEKVPQLNPEDIDDLMLGCGLPGGEQGFNMARVAAVLLGYDHLPGVTLTRYCASSLQTTRMAFHAIKAVEGDVFISAGVEMVSRYVNGNSDSLSDTMNPVFAGAQARTARAAGDGAGSWSNPREDGAVPDIYMAMGQTAENLALLKGISRAEMDQFGVRSQNLAEKALANGFWARDHAGEPAGRHDRGERRRPPVRGDHRGRDRAPAGVPSVWAGDGRQLLPAQRRRRRGGHHVGY
jgi:acetyl-CoA C-acetyltransferase